MLTSTPIGVYYFLFGLEMVINVGTNAVFFCAGGEMVNLMAEVQPGIILDMSAIISFENDCQLYHEKHRWSVVQLCIYGLNRPVHWR